MQIKKYTLLALAASLMLGFSACSDDDNNGGGNNGDDNTDTALVPKPEQIFTQGIPSEVGDLSITTNADGLVSEITQKDNGVVEKISKFKYGTFTLDRANEYQVEMTVTETEDDDTYLFYIALNEKGFASDVIEIEPDGDIETWSFDYDSADRLIKMVRSEGGNEVTTITYTDGDITSVSQIDEDGDGWTHIITYGSNPIENKGAIMMYDETFSIDMDEFAPAFYAGLLGKATAHLPAKNQGEDESDYETYDWTLNAAGLPIKLVVTEFDPWAENPTYDTFTFVW